MYPNRPITALWHIPCLRRRPHSFVIYVISNSRFSARQCKLPSLPRRGRRLRTRPRGDADSQAPRRSVTVDRQSFFKSQNLIPLSFEKFPALFFSSCFRVQPEVTDHLPRAFRFPSSSQAMTLPLCAYMNKYSSRLHLVNSKPNCICAASGWYTCNIYAYVCDFN